jgi:uncharacterized protein (TIGR00725 family)
MPVSEKHQVRRLIGAVVGSARDGSAGEAEAALLGRALVDAGFRLVCGGLGGIMRAASRGARSSKRYQPGDVIGVLPSYRAADANEFVDIPICTGLQHGRNLVVVATGDVVFAVGGRSGTLCEIALAWTLGKPVVCVGNVEGWATELSGRCIDDRREDQVHGPFEPEEAVTVAMELIQTHRYGPKEF